MASNQSIEAILAESEREAGRYAWEGTFADYLRIVVQNSSQSRLSHSLVYEAIVSQGVETAPDGQSIYGLFEGEIFGLERALDRIVQYFAASAQRLEVRKRILLFLGPPASGKSSIVDLIKRALESYTRTDEGAVYAIRGCPMQEEPLHLIPPRLRDALQEQYGIYVEGDLCPRCRYMLRGDYGGKVSEVPVRRVTFSEQEAIGIGYYIATNPNPSDASLLVGSVDTSQLEGDRLEVAGKAFRLDGEFNVANRGIIEFVEMFKADRHLLTTLLGLAQEQLIKMERFGSLYADEVIIGHSNEGDFTGFASDERSEALRDRIIAIQIPYNLRVGEEVKIYQKMMRDSELHGVHLAPLTLRADGIFAVLSRLEPPSRQGMSLMDKLRLYDGQMVQSYTDQDLREMQRHHPDEGVRGISPRYVMNRLGAAASKPEVTCISPLAALDSLWQGLRENISLDQGDLAKYVGFIAESVKEYSVIAIKDVQRAFEESFEQSAAMLLDGYLASVAASASGSDRGPSADDTVLVSERDMREIERAIGVTERSKREFRQEINQIVSAWKKRGLTFDYTSEPRIRAAIESRLFPAHRKVERALTQPRFAKQRVEWARLRGSVANRLVSSYGYCPECAEDLVNFVPHALKNRPVLKTPKNEGIEWLWPLNPASTGLASKKE
jgi:serine protein kinase